MIEISEALSLVLGQAHAKPAVRKSLSDAVEHVLAEQIASDIDSPPHDKSLVDGYAVVAQDLAKGAAELRILEEVTAGALPSQAVTEGTATRIMTGAPIPAGCDAIVMLEQTESIDGDTRVRIRGAARVGQHIMRRAASLGRGDIVLRPGRAIRPVEIGLLAEVGRQEVLVVQRPTVAVLATGSELVPADQQPQAGQIRNSNGPMLCSLVRRATGNVVDLGIGIDEPRHLRQLMQQGLQHDLLVLSGGVSAGVLDLVPGVLEQLGVRPVFHKVSLKPGKPLWFGCLERDGRSCLVFGLPGNPVSSLVCFELFVRPAINALAGMTGPSHSSIRAELTRDHQQRGQRPTFWPATLRTGEDRATIEPLDWQGSADLRTLVDANALAFFPAGDRQFVAGESVAVCRLSS